MPRPPDSSPAPAPVAFADVRAQLAVQWRTAAGTDPVVERLDDVSGALPPGFTAWSVNDSAPVVLPTLSEDAPTALGVRYRVRVLALATGVCPACGAIASLGPTDPQRTPAAWHVMPLAFGIRHAEECPARFGPDDRRWFDRRAFGDGGAR